MIIGGVSVVFLFIYLYIHTFKFVCYFFLESSKVIEPTKLRDLRFIIHRNHY
jgi:hypothetical protein